MGSRAILDPRSDAAGSSLAAPRPRRESIERQVDHRRRVEREQLAEEKAADDGDAQRTPQLRSDAVRSASGSAPSSAAIVVIMIGRKRSRQAW